MPLEASNLLSFPCRAQKFEAAVCAMAPEIAAQRQKIDGLDGSLERVEAKLDSLTIRTEDRLSALMYWLMGVLAAVLITFAGVLIKK